MADRSLGFRWFFCFLLFTQFRAQRRSSHGTLFLFDEPASNLHAKAQEKLLGSFKGICGSPNSLIYSTHSPYMINPMWLDKAYIVENASIGADLDDIASMTTSEDTAIVATPYHDFIETNPQRISHFQPALDRLEVKPSLLDVKQNSILVEGKSDYVILSTLFANIPSRKFHLIPAHGASTMGPLISLLKGWNWNFAVLLDGDKAGAEAKQKYVEEYGLSGNVVTLKDIHSSLTASESLIVENDLEMIQKALELSKSPSKKQIYNFFLEAEASGKALKLSSRQSAEFKEVAKAFKAFFE